MGNDELDISFINHDLKNDVGVAISCLQLVTIDFPELKKNENIAAAIESLSRANELSTEIAICCDNNKTVKNNSAPNFSTLSALEHIFTNVKPAYDRLKKTYPQLRINDKYRTIEEGKYILVNSNTLTRFRENIVANAINANVTTLEIKLDMKEHCIVVSYTDNGNGMTSEEIEKVILSQYGDGIIHGIGTKSILKIAHEHNVFISYASKVGKGTTIRAIVPYVNR